MINNCDADIPRIIWFFWHSGLETAPAIVKICFTSWVKQNPDYSVVLVTGESAEYGDCMSSFRQSELIPIQKRSNLLRLHLLNRHGGVWVDATLFCRRPLSEWLPGEQKHGVLFCENYPSRRDRVLANFFIGAVPQHPLLLEWHQAASDFFTRPLRHKFSTDHEERITRVGKYLALRRWTDGFWTSALNRYLLRIYPYFIHHYLFARLIRQRSELHALWEISGKIRLGSWPLTFNSVLSKGSPLTSQSLDVVMEAPETPFFKVTYRQKAQLGKEREFLAEYLSKWLENEPGKIS
jgi:hypothetical protein